MHLWLGNLDFDYLVIVFYRSSVSSLCCVSIFHVNFVVKWICLCTQNCDVSSDGSWHQHMHCVFTVYLLIILLGFRLYKYIDIPTSQ